MAIKSLSDKITEEFFYTGDLPAKGCKWKPQASVAYRKLEMLDAAVQLQDLRAPLGNRLESLSGDLNGWHSIRVNNQWRVLFVWTQEGPTEVRIDDYH